MERALRCNLFYIPCVNCSQIRSEPFGRVEPQDVYRVEALQTHLNEGFGHCAHVLLVLLERNTSPVFVFVPFHGHSHTVWESLYCPMHHSRHRDGLFGGHTLLADTQLDCAFGQAIEVGIARDDLVGSFEVFLHLNFDFRLSCHPGWKNKHTKNDISIYIHEKNHEC